MANKFLIVNNNFLFSSSIKYHYELLPATATRQDVFGGGWWYMDRKNKKMYLYDKSEDFGYATRENILKALERTLLPQYLDGFKFYISKCSNLDDAIGEANCRCDGEDWIFDYNSDLVVEEVLQEKVTKLENTKPRITNIPITNPNKQNRNDLCKCGSGKKFKKCCL